MNGGATTTPRMLAATARGLYADGPPLLRLLTRARPYICPFEILLDCVPSGSRVLDVGCGGGLLLALLARHRALRQGTGFDSSVTAVALAERMIEHSGLSGVVRITRLDARAPWPQGTWDVVALVDVLHHVPPSAQQGVIENAVQRVAPGGLLLYKDMAMTPAWCRWMNKLHDLVLARQWIHELPVARVDEWVLARNLSVVRSESPRRLWYSHDVRVYQRAAAG